jgi:CRP-like cAMP-binding protein
MGSALKISPEPDFRQDYRRLAPPNLDRRLLESITASNRAGSRAVLEMEASDTQSWWRTAPILRDLSNVECERIVSSAAQRQYANRDVIVMEGDDGAEILVVASGRVKVTQISHTGDEVILRVNGPGDVMGGLGMAPGETHSSTIRALEACTVLRWRAEDFDCLCNRFPSLQRNALQIMSDILHVLQECFCEMATLRVPSRLARTLVRLSEQSDGGGRNVPIAFTCEELGQMTGTTLFTVSRLLCQWTEMGLICSEKRGIVIEDVGGLLAIADESRAPASRMSAR